MHTFFVLIKFIFFRLMQVVVKTVNFILSKGLNHHQFQELLQEVESDYGDLLYFSEVRWLNPGAMLQ